MVEEAHSCECNYHIVFISRVDYEVVTDRAAGLSYVGYTAALCSLDVVTKEARGAR